MLNSLRRGQHDEVVLHLIPLFFSIALEIEHSLVDFAVFREDEFFISICSKKKRGNQTNIILRLTHFYLHSKNSVNSNLHMNYASEKQDVFFTSGLWPGCPLDQIVKTMHVYL